MKPFRLRIVLGALLLCSLPAFAADQDSKSDDNPDKSAASQDQGDAAAVAAMRKSQSSTTQGTVSVEGNSVAYDATAGTLVLNGDGQDEHTPQASMSYVAYIKRGADPAKRPIMFIYNGGPGSSTIWLHMGAFGPKRISTNDDSHTPAAPYQLVNNDYSLLDVSDLVFVDAPGTGFGRLLPKGKTDEERAKNFKDLSKKIWSVDGDGKIFAKFITTFLTQHDRWNSPKYLFGESYGTTRSAVVAADLETDNDVDLNGVILLSQILNFATSVDGADNSPGIDLPYVLALPTYAATAWYHHKLPKYNNGGLQPLLQQATKWATTEYEQALLAGATLGPDRQKQIAQKLSDFTGLPVDYLLKANLRVTGGMFEHELQNGDDVTTGRLDTRFAGPSMDPMGKESDYDPQSASISSAYVAAFNDYVRSTLKFGQDMHYRQSAYGEEDFDWDFRHKLPGQHFSFPGATNVLPDLAVAMKYNPDLKVMMNGGFYDLATPYYAAIYELEHLPIPQTLRKNISFAFYPSGHMVYAHTPSLKTLHDNVAKFVQGTDNQQH
ncbi:MAG: S10 family peptidase [Rhodanobacteraceae bacterium]